MSDDSDKPSLGRRAMWAVTLGLAATTPSDRNVSPEERARKDKDNAALRNAWENKRKTQEAKARQLDAERKAEEEKKAAEKERAAKQEEANAKILAALAEAEKQEAQYRKQRSISALKKFLSPEQTLKDNISALDNYEKTRQELAPKMSVIVGPIFQASLEETALLRAKLEKMLNDMQKKDFENAYKTACKALKEASGIWGDNPIPEIETLRLNFHALPDLDLRNLCLTLAQDPIVSASWGVGENPEEAEEELEMSGLRNFLTINPLKALQRHAGKFVRYAYFPEEVYNGINLNEKISTLITHSMKYPKASAAEKPAVAKKILEELQHIKKDVENAEGAYIAGLGDKPLIDLYHQNIKKGWVSPMGRLFEVAERGVVAQISRQQEEMRKR